MSVRAKLWFLVVLLGVSGSVSLMLYEVASAMVAAVLIVLIAVATVIAVVGVIEGIAKPMQAMQGAIKLASEGNLAVDLSYMVKFGDEAEQTAKWFGEVSRQISELSEDIKKVSRIQDTEASNISIDDKKYSGIYREIAKNANRIIQANADDIAAIFENVNRLAQGEVNPNIKSATKRNQSVNDAIALLSSNLSSVSSDIGKLCEMAASGKYTGNINASAYKNNWKLIVNQANQLYNSFGEFIGEATTVMGKMADGNFNAQLSGVYMGDLLPLSKAINTAAETVASNIGSVVSVLRELAGGNLSVSAKYSASGDFASIRDALQALVGEYGDLLQRIGDASEQMASGVRQISDCNGMLAGGTAQQALFVGKLSETIAHISKKTSDTALNAEKAAKYSEMSMKNAERGNREMKNMLTAMDGIKISSDNISRVIKVIDDIAFQTNLLALNASVEAAHAGEHGKGFTVVAEEVRKLSGMSQEAVIQTTALIDDTISKVDQGVGIAKATADVLEKIMEGVTGVSKIIVDIDAASVEQTGALSQVTTGFKSISDVTQQSTSALDENTAASKALSDQSELLRDMVRSFKLQKKGNDGNVFAKRQDTTDNKRPVPARILDPVTKSATPTKASINAKPTMPNNSASAKSSRPIKSSGVVAAPSASHVYDAKDFGKY